MVNPLTIIGFKKIIQQINNKNILINAANSQLSRMMIKHFTKHKVGNITGIVRNRETVNQML